MIDLEAGECNVDRINHDKVQKNQVNLLKLLKMFIQNRIFLKSGSGAEVEDIYMSVLIMTMYLRVREVLWLLLAFIPQL